jgi:hypothetical protein
MRFISFDCGIKTLAWVYIDIDIENKVIKKVNEFKCKVHNLIADKAVKAVNDLTKIQLLTAYIKTLDAITDDTIVLIEAQPCNVNNNFNTSSILVSHVLATLYISMNKQVHYISPKIKNKVKLDNSLDICNYKNTYSGRKKQSTDSLLYFINEHNISSSLTNIEKKLYNHVADALMQTIAFICTNDSP